MNETPETRPGPTRRLRIRLGALAAIAVAIGFIVWAVVGTGGGGGGSSTPPTRNVKGTNPVALSLSGLKTIAGALRQPIYWVGTKTGMKYELRQTTDAKVYVRYLPSAVQAGDPRAFLTVGTYPMQDAFSATQAIAKGGVQINAGQGAVAVQPKGDSARVYMTFSGNNYLIEVYSPTPGQARRFVERGSVRAVPVAKPITPRVRATSPAGLKRLAVALGQPIYWAGPEPNVTYELTQTKSGRIYVRYLPKGVKVGDPGVFRTVATYAVPNAYAATKALAKHPNTGSFRLSGGGIAAFGEAPKTTDIYLAYPTADYQVEVYDPTPGTARKLVKSEQVTAVG